MTAVDMFLSTVRASLHVGARRGDRIAAEMRDHLESTADALRTGGYSSAAAEREALARMGPADDLVRALNDTESEVCRGDRRLSLRHLVLALVTSSAALVIMIRAFDGGLVLTRPVILSSGTALLVLLHGAYGFLRPYSVTNCAAGLIVSFLGVFVIVCHGLFARSIGVDYDALAVGLGVFVLLQGSLSAVTAYDHPLLT